MVKNDYQSNVGKFSESVQYALTLDMAKEISMIQHN